MLLRYKLIVVSPSREGHYGPRPSRQDEIHRMKPMSALVIATVTLLAGCGGTVPAEDRPLSEADVRDSVAVVLERVSAAAVAKDVDAFMSLWEHSDSVLYSRHGRTFIGWEEIRAEHARAFADTEPWSYETGAVHARSLGPNAGVGTAFVKLTSSRDSNWFIITLSVSASSGAWRIVQGHGSYPAPNTTPRGEPEP